MDILLVLLCPILCELCDQGDPLSEAEFAGLQNFQNYSMSNPYVALCALLCALLCVTLCFPLRNSVVKQSPWKCIEKFKK